MSADSRLLRIGFSVFVFLSLCGSFLFVVRALAPQGGGPWILFGTIATGDATVPDFSQSSSVICVAFPGGGHVYLDGYVGSDGYFQTTRTIGTGGYGNCAASSPGYLNASTDFGPISSDTSISFSIYSAIAWLSGSLNDAVSGAAVNNGGVTAVSGGTAYANVTGNNYNFGGTVNHPAAGGGLGVSRAPGVQNGSGSASYAVTATAVNYLSESINSLTLTSGQNAAQSFNLYPAQGNIKGTIYDGSTGLPMTVAPTIYANEAGKYATFTPSGGTYTFASASQPPDWGLPVTRQGQSGPGYATYTLNVSATGYATYVSGPTQISSGQSTTLDIYLYPSGDETGPCNHQCEKQAGQPIDLTTGNVWIQQQDYSLPGLGGGIQLTRTWNSRWQNVSPPSSTGMFGQNWRSTYEENLVFVRSDTLKYWRGDGSAWLFHYDAVNHLYSLVNPPDERATLTFDSGTTLYTLTLADGSKRIFKNNGYLTAIQDRNGNQTTITYDPTWNRITQVTDAAGRTLSFTFNPSWPQLVATVQDATGVIATYTYDSYQRLTQVRYADNSTLTFGLAQFSSSPLIYNVVDANGKVLESHNYDGLSRGTSSQRANGVDAVSVSYTSDTTTTLTDSASHSTTYRFRSIGARRYISSINGSGCASCGGRGNTTLTFDTKANRTSTTDALGRTTNYAYDLMANVTTRFIVVGGSTITWNYTYNGFGEVLTATDPLGKVTTNTYDAKGNLLTTTTPSPDGVQPGSTTTFTYDLKGQLLTVADPRNNTTTISYNTAGLISSITDAANNVTTFAYDVRGNRTSITDPNNKTTTFTYDVMNRLTRITYPDTTTTNFAYDIRGRRTSVTDANNKTTAYAYDDADRLTSATDAANQVTGYAYDNETNLTGITDPSNRTTSFTYDAFGRVTRTTFPSTLYETYVYDAMGNLTSKTDRKGQTITYTYDQLNRLTQKSYPDSTNVTYSYDTASRLTQPSDATGTYQFAYDNLGRLTGTTTNYSFLASRSFTTSYAYDAASNRASFTDPESGVTTYAYDVLNRLTSLTSPQGQFTFSYDVLSRRTQLTRPNGVNTSYSYDNLSRLLSVLHQKAGATLDGTSYTVDAVGNRTSKTDQPSTTASNFAYDAIYQLTGVTQGANTTESYSYDAVGNRLSSLGVSPYSYNVSNQLTAKPGVTYTYDNNGNTLTKTDASGTTTYAWDFENRLTSVTLPGAGGTVTFKYDPFGRRIYKSSSSGTSVFAYDGDNLIEEVNSSGAVVARYTQGQNIDEPLAMLRSGATSFYEADGLGSVTSLTDSSGSVAASYTYDSFGNLTASTGTLTNPFRYTARELDLESGLYFYRARYYDQNLGRFLNEDPIGFDGGIDFYAYVENNPVELRDVWGLQARPKPIPTPAPLDPTPSRPVLVPSPAPVAPSVGEEILTLLGRIAGTAGTILASPMDLNPNEPDPGADPNPGPGRRITPPECPNRGCRCTCRADADDTMPGNIKPGKGLFAFGTATAPSCAEASKAAKRIATRKLAMKPKHIPCVCVKR